ncbi:AraC family transcriptional regulator [Gimesia aquarii]|uniref:Bifunctional transcriptional activator/DNA repair enzyme Ada n=1 Tax=Gimesia aquarii TaxID=2527964 RepID=A0A517VSC8_9PLAN|nr:AraC family transcriptional regulator [Gimesia aquarii]QDT95911.1 Bifunctional transcriptional activator/DNA repair enzyme Ada [Gimesia aquarii]
MGSAKKRSKKSSFRGNTKEGQQSFRSHVQWLKESNESIELIDQCLSDRGEIALSHIFLSEECSAPPASSDLVISTVIKGRSLNKKQVDLGFGRFDITEHPGYTLVFTPNVDIEFTEPGPYEILTLSIPWSRLQPQIELVLNRPMPHLTASIHGQQHKDPLLAQTLKQLWDPINGNSVGDVLIRDGLINILLGRLLQIADLNVPVVTPRSKLSDSKLANVREFIDQSLEQPISLDMLADIANCSRFHFARLFKASMGMTPMAYVSQCRVERAKQLINKNNEWSLSVIATKSGFSDQSHMNRHFKKIIGITSGQYAKSANGW